MTDDTLDQVTERVAASHGFVRRHGETNNELALRCLDACHHKLMAEISANRQRVNKSRENLAQFAHCFAIGIVTLIIALLVLSIWTLW